MPEVLGELGRFNSAPWIGQVTCPTAVVVTDHDHAIPAQRQHQRPAAIPGAEAFELHGGHVSLISRHAAWQESLCRALASVVQRRAKAA
jgi:hypothetical protein